MFITLKPNKMLKINYMISISASAEVYSIISTIQSINYQRPNFINLWHNMIYDAMNKIAKVYRDELKKYEMYAICSFIHTSGIMEIQVLDIAGNNYVIDIDMCIDKEIIAASLPLSNTAVIFTPRYLAMPVK